MESVESVDVNKKKSASETTFGTATAAVVKINKASLFVLTVLTEC